MSQHNIMGSEAFNKGPFVIIRAVKSGGFRRRRSRSVAAYAVVAILALSAGAAGGGLAAGPPAGAGAGLRAGPAADPGGPGRRRRARGADARCRRRSHAGRLSPQGPIKLRASANSSPRLRTPSF